MSQYQIIVSQLIDSPYAITLEDGNILYCAVYELLQTGKTVEVDFQDVEIFASPFFNAAIGRLLADFTSDYLREHLRPI